MPAALCNFVLGVLTLCGSTVLSEVLRAPTNVHLSSYNMDLVLRWDPPPGLTSGVVYTTEYRVLSVYKAGCVNITRLECDFTRLKVSNQSVIVEYGKYTGRVRAHMGSETSDWVESKLITVDENTVIGPPNITLHSLGSTIEVSVTDPEFAISSLRRVYLYANYNISYWKEDQKDKVKHLTAIQQNRLVLHDLDPKTKYCVQVQIYTERNPKPSQPSEIVCASTTNREEVPWVAALVTFLFMVMAVVLVVVGVVYRKNISNFLFPKDTLPQHFKEYLLAPPNSNIYNAMWSSDLTEEICDSVSIIPDDKTEEERCTLEVTKTTCTKPANVTVVGT